LRWRRRGFALSGGIRLSRILGGGEREDSPARLRGDARGAALAGRPSGSRPLLRVGRRELDERLPALLRGDAELVETLFSGVGSGQSGFVVPPDEFVHGFWQADKRLTIHLGESAVTILLEGELGEALQRE